MTRSRALNLGLVAGCLAGLVVHPTPVLQSVPMVVTASVPYAPQVVPMRWLPPGTPLADAHDDCPGPDFSDELVLGVSLIGRDLRGADFRNTVLLDVDLTCASLDGARFDGARCDAGTRWPEGFDPREHGARLIAVHYGKVIRETP